MFEDQPLEGLHQMRAECYSAYSCWGPLAVWSSSLVPHRRLSTAVVLSPDSGSCWTCTIQLVCTAPWYFAARSPPVLKGIGWWWGRWAMGWSILKQRGWVMAKRCIVMGRKAGTRWRREVCSRDDWVWGVNVCGWVNELNQFFRSFTHPKSPRAWEFGLWFEIVFSLFQTTLMLLYCSWSSTFSAPSAQVPAPPYFLT